jgi:arginase
MKVQILVVPYDSGHKDVRMGRGPKSFLEFGLVDQLQKDGHSVEVEEIELRNFFCSEVSAAFEINRILSKRVRSLVQEGKFPLVLSGNCNCSIGTMAGTGCKDAGLIWFDGHGDFNTPESTESGFLDGMALAIATGHCWRKLAASIPDFQPLAEHDVVLVGARHFDVEEKKLLDRSGIAHVSSPFIRHINIVEALKPALAALEPRVKKVHLHIDLDVLDPKQTPANQFSPPDGLLAGETELAIRMIRGRFPVSSACLAAYDPEYDPHHATAQAGIKFVQTLLS